MTVALQPGLAVTLISARVGTGPGDTFALSGRACALGWQLSYDVAPDAVSVTLEISMDGTVWAVLDTSTAVGGAFRNITTVVSAPFIRANVGTNTGDRAATVTLIAKVANP